MKLVMETYQSFEKCKICTKIDIKNRSIREEEAKIKRLKHELGRFGFIEKAEDTIYTLKQEIHTLEYDKYNKSQQTCRYWERDSFAGGGTINETTVAAVALTLPSPFTHIRTIVPPRSSPIDAKSDYVSNSKKPTSKPSLRVRTLSQARSISPPLSESWCNEDEFNAEPNDLHHSPLKVNALEVKEGPSYVYDL
jgi:hypothetical protein